jgi:hypothetical protein
MTIALITAVISAPMGTLGGFLSGSRLQRAQARRDHRVQLFLEHVPACRQEITAYGAALREEGPIAAMSVHPLSTKLTELYRAAVVASRTDEAHARDLVLAAKDLQIARHRSDTDDRPRRMREGGWAKLACDTIDQAEQALESYEQWLGRRLLARRPRRGHRRYRSIEIDRDCAGEDPTRFAQPEVLSSQHLERLLEQPVRSWAVVENAALDGRLLFVWVDSLEQDLALRFYETDGDWLHPRAQVEDPVFPGLWRVVAALKEGVAAPDDRRINESSIVVADQALPDLTRLELDTAVPH